MSLSAAERLFRDPQPYLYYLVHCQGRLFIEKLVKVLRAYDEKGPKKAKDYLKMSKNGQKKEIQSKPF